MTYAALVARDRIPQTEPLDATQVRNNAGGFVFALDAFARLDRFLILGSDSGTFYQKARALTAENAGIVRECWAADAARTAARIREISVGGRAPKNSPAILALAIGLTAESVDARRAAADTLGAVCRTATHLFELLSLCDALGRGMGRTLKRAVRQWYEGRPVDQLGYQMVKYRTRQGYDHSRAIKRARPAAADGDARRVDLYRWAIGREVDRDALPEKVRGHLEAMATTSVSDLLPLVERYGLEREMVPNWAETDAKVWEALLPNLGLTALLRNLGTLTSLGVVRPLGPHNAAIADRLTDADEIRKARVHPYAILNALAVYRSGRSVEGERTWKAEGTVCDSLNDAFYLAFSNVRPTGKRHMLALDVSGSMGSSLIGGVLSAREASAAMALVTARTERAHHFVGFSHGIVDLNISPRMRLDEVVRKVSGIPFGATDASLAMTHALEKGIEVDAFVAYTDNETFRGRIHPSEALRRYRKETGIPAKLVCVGMTSTGFTIADPKDAGMLDVVGFDANAVSVMADFVRA